MATIALVDDHALLRNGLAVLVKSLGHTVVVEASNGKDFISKLDPSNLPRLVLMDINMPEMDGYETTQWLKQNHPEVTVMALSMYDTETAIIRMMKCGAKGYILKDSDPSELQAALEALFNKGHYYTELVNSKMINAISNMENTDNEIKNLIQINEKETEFLKLICTELTYKEIADKMQVSPRTVDNYRDSLFEKTNVKTRIGLAMFAVRNGVVQF
jgi:two-component system, NarL family, invasion response regulator UvrY